MNTLVEDLKHLESAEDFLNYFAIPYDVAVVHVNRLHILKRFQQYLVLEGGVEGLPAASAFATCRALLARAHNDFVASSGIEQKVFKVFQTAQGEHHVAIEGLRRRLGS